MLDTYELRDSILMLKRKLEDMEMELQNLKRHQSITIEALNNLKDQVNSEKGHQSHYDYTEN